MGDLPKSEKATLSDDAQASVPGSTVDIRGAHESPASAGMTVDFDGSPDAAKISTGPAETGGTVEFAANAAPAGTIAGDQDSGNLDFSLSPDVEALASQVNVPGYQVVGELGRGAMGVVYKARQVGLNRWVALKMVLAGGHAGSAALARFRAEAKAVALLHHPNIVQIYDVGEHEGLPYFSLEFVDGGVLSDKVHRQPQPAKEAAHLVETLARAMYYAHQHGVVHRDLKPSNVLLTVDGIPKISDFGLAKAQEGDSTQTKSGTILGTPSYMAPEQARGEIHNVGPAADIYALGAMLYELVTGRPPFEGATIMQTVMMVTRDEPMPPSRLQPKTPPDLETICLKCLEKDAVKRYATAEALAEDLRRYLAGEPILARPISAPARLWRWCRRNPRVAVLSAAVFLLLIFVSIGSVLSNIWIRQEQAETQRAEKLAKENARLKQLEAERALKAEKKAEENAKVAGEQRTLALNTLYSVVTKVEDKLKQTEGMNDVRKEILKAAMEGLGKVSKTVENATIVDRSMGVAFQRMGDLHEQLGETEEAERLHKLALKIFTDLHAEDPDNDWLPWNEAVSFDKLASLSQEFHGDSAAALDYLQKSLKLRQKLVSDPHSVTPPFPVKREIALIVSYMRLGALTRHLGDPATSRDYAGRGVKECDALVAASPKDGSAPYFRAACQHILGLASARLNAADDARKVLTQCLEWRRTKLAKDKTSSVAKREVGAAYEALGDVELEQKNGKLALEHYGKAFELYDALYKKEPDNAETRWYLAHSYYRQGTAKDSVGNQDGARKDFTESMKLRQGLVKQDPKNMQFRSELMLCHARLGRHKEASKLCDEIRQRAFKNPSVLLTAACGYALCSRAVASDKTSPSPEQIALAGRYADLAVDTLKQAINLRYQDVVRLQSDPDLAALRTHPEYIRLADRLRTKAQLP